MVNCEPKSDKLLFYIHGGGFCITTTLTYQVFLNDWAKKLNIPIFSIDYSLAPENPYPAAIEEIFYAYCWMLKHPKTFGTTAEKVVLAGDSAGAFLCKNLIIKCIEHGIRVPDAALLAYGGLTFQMIPHPSYLLTFCFSLINVQYLYKFQKSYGGIPSKSMDPNDFKILHEKRMKTGRRDAIPKASLNELCYTLPNDHCFSVIETPDSILKEFPPIHFVVSLLVFRTTS